MVELWPGVADCCKPLPVRHSFGALFPFEEWLGFVTVSETTAFFEASARVLFDPAESSSFQSFKLTSETEPSSSKLSVVVSLANCNDSSIPTTE